MKRLFLALALLSPLSLKATDVNISFVFQPNTNFMAGMTTNAYITNLVVNIRSTVNINTPTNLWPTVASAPMFSYLTQGPVGSTWTNLLTTDAQARFYTIQITNLNGVIGSFTPPIPALPAVEVGVISQPLKVVP